jgi:hypothetical protein
MPSTDIQDAQSGAVFSNAELGRLMRVIQDKTFQETRALAVERLTLFEDDGATPLAEAEQALRKQTRADLLQFFDVVGDGTIQAGQDFSQVRDKEEIRQAVRLRLGLPAVSSIIATQEAEADAARRRRRCTTSVTTKTVFN